VNFTSTPEEIAGFFYDIGPDLIEGRARVENFLPPIKSLFLGPEEAAVDFLK